MVYDTSKLCSIERFRYLGQVLAHKTNTSPAMWRNTKKVWGTWGQVPTILTCQGIPTPVAGMF